MLTYTQLAVCLQVAFSDTGCLELPAAAPTNMQQAAHVVGFQVAFVDAGCLELLAAALTSTQRCASLTLLAAAALGSLVQGNPATAERFVVSRGGATLESVVWLFVQAWNPLDPPEGCASLVSLHRRRKAAQSA